MARQVFLVGRLNGTETSMGRGILLWLLGIPLPVLLLLWAFGVLH